MNLQQEHLLFSVSRPAASRPAAATTTGFQDHGLGGFQVIATDGGAGPAAPAAPWWAAAAAAAPQGCAAAKFPIGSPPSGN
jgi:nuclear transcription factor Y, alpha